MSPEEQLRRQIDEPEIINRLSYRLGVLRRLIEKGAPEVILNNQRSMVLQSALQLPQGTIHYTTDPERDRYFLCGEQSSTNDTATVIEAAVNCQDCRHLLDNPDGKCHQSPKSGDCGLEYRHSGYCDWEGR